jgi:Na+-transporting NADH:ubiquinone oxidoreductase subunit NqrF
MWAAIAFCFIIIVLLVVIGFLTKALIIQIKKNEIYETWIAETQNRVDATYEVMKSLDDRGMFSKDDDVGEAFDKMVQVVTYLNDVTTKE